MIVTEIVTLVVLTKYLLNDTNGMIPIVHRKAMWVYKYLEKISLAHCHRVSRRVGGNECISYVNFTVSQSGAHYNYARVSHARTRAYFRQRG